MMRTASRPFGVSLLFLLLALTQLRLSASKPIEDLLCEAETVDGANTELHERLETLRSEAYFGIFKVNLYSECKFWKDDGQCANRACSVCGPCPDDEVPLALREESISSSSSDGGEGEPSPVDRTLWGGFQGWQETNEHVWIEQDSSPDMSYIDLRLNPEGYTGYGPPASTIIWRAIFSENCFQHGNIKEMCYEERVFYRLLSGVQSNIAAHVAGNYPVDDDPHAENPVTKPNLEIYDRMLGRFPERLNNLYFSLVFLLRALNKASPLLASRSYSIGDPEVDARVKREMNDLLNSRMVRDCSPSNSFDESIMFSTPDTAPIKKQFKAHFRNISRIMDCVTCEKCRLHGKIQMLGVGTALKILLDDKPLDLSRNEILALINMLGKLSNSIRIVQEIEWMRQRKNLLLYAGIGLAAAATLAAPILVVLIIRRRRAKRRAKKTKTG